MSKKLVLEILEECVFHQDSAIAGGIVGGKKELEMARQDLARLEKARDWFKNTYCK